MKLRTVFSLLIVLFLVSTFNITIGFAQEPPQSLRLDGPSTNFAFSPDSTMIATTAKGYSIDGRKVKIWDAETGTLLRSLEHPNVRTFNDVAFSPDSATIATASDDWKVRLWDVKTGEIRHTLIGHNGEVLGVAYSPDGSTLASGSRDDRSVRIWDAATGTIRHTIPNTGHNYYHNIGDGEGYIVYSPDGTTLVTPTYGSVYLIDVATGTLRYTINYGDSVRDVEYSPDGNTLAICGNNGGVQIWDVTTGTRLHRLGHAGWVKSVAYSPDSSTLISGGGEVVRVWDVATGNPIDVLPTGLSEVNGVAYSPDGTTFACATSSGNTYAAAVWDAATRTFLHNLKGHNGSPLRVAYSPDSATLAAMSYWIVLYRFAPPPPPIIFTPSEVADQTFTVGTPVSLTLPFVTGGTAPYTYTLTPIPNGLQFDPTTRELHGTPLAAMDATPVTYTATDTKGASASLTFTITVQDTPSLTDLYMYWADIETNKIQRANLDGTNVQDLLTGFGRPTGITLDISSGKIYWTDSDRAGQYGIHRMNLDGTNIETLVVGEPFVGEQIALDISGGKMYWALQFNKIQRANLDGTNVEDLVIGQEEPRGMALDLPAGKMYWTDLGAGKIQRANLDGSNIEVLVTGLDGPSFIALDVNSGKLYWTDWTSGKVQRANSNGTNLEDIVIGLSSPVGIALDSLNGKMYWVEAGSDKIQRANLDGTNVETLVTGVRFPVGIALSVPQVLAGLRLSPNVIADRTFTVGTAVNLTLPTAIGGTPPYLYNLTPSLPAGLSFDPIANGPGHIGGTPTAAMPATPFTYTATDATSASVSLTFTITVKAGGLPLDVNGDGRVDVLDLVQVALFYGKRGNNLREDVNADGVINVTDLVAVANGIDAVDALSLAVEEGLLLALAEAVELEAIAEAPIAGGEDQHALSLWMTSDNVAAALADVRHLATGDVRLEKGVETVLEELLVLLTEMRAIPDQTALLPNYPNPFNPETWMPYHLAKAADVTVTIHDVRGVLVRALTLGHQAAGVYESRGRAAYWDGRNQLGEPVASGLYFYTLTAGDFTATRKLLIAK